MNGLSTMRWQTVWSFFFSFHHHERKVSTRISLSISLNRFSRVFLFAIIINFMGNICAVLALLNLSSSQPAKQHTRTIIRPQAVPLKLGHPPAVGGHYAMWRRSLFAV